MKMKDEGSERRPPGDDGEKVNGELPSMDEVDEESSQAVTSNGKSRNKMHRKRRGSSSPEEDIIDGFAISSYPSLEALESNGPSKPNLIDGTHKHPKIARRSIENGVTAKKKRSEKRRARMHHRGAKVRDSDSEDENSDRAKNNNSRPVATQKEKLPIVPNDQARSDSEDSDRGYMCDAESEGERVSDNESAKENTTPKSSSFSAVNLITTTKPSSIDASKSDTEKTTVKLSEATSSPASTPQRPNSRNSLSASGLPLTFATTTSSSHSHGPAYASAGHGGMFPHFPSFHSPPGGPMSYPHGPGELPFGYPNPSKYFN